MLKGAVRRAAVINWEPYLVALLQRLYYQLHRIQACLGQDLGYHGRRVISPDSEQYRSCGYS